MKATGQPGHSASRCSSSRFHSHSRSRSTHNSIDIPRRRLYRVLPTHLHMSVGKNKGKNCSLLRAFDFLLRIVSPLLLTFTQKACSHGWRKWEGDQGNIFEHCTLIMRRKEKKRNRSRNRNRNRNENPLRCATLMSRVWVVFVANFRGCASDVGRVKGALNYAPVAYESECHFCCSI